MERWQELVLGGAAIFWGLLLLLPDDTLGGVPRYSAMSRYLPDQAWGALLITSGVILIGLLPYAWRANANALIAFVWGFIVVLILSSGLSLPALLIATPYVALVLLHLFEFFRLSQLAKL